MRAWVIMLAAAACGSGAEAPRPPSKPPAAFEPTPAAGDVVVARVNGRPVWGACVRGQAAHAADKQAALQQCIDFELLAQAAERFATDPDVVLATHTAMVSQLVGVDYEDAYQHPEDFGGNWQRLVGQNLFRVRHEEYRASAYVRVPVGSGAPPAADAAAHAVAQRVADGLAAATGIVGPELYDLAQPLAGATRLDHQIVDAMRVGALDPPYAQALFAIPDIGRTAGPVRTKWGWDVIAYIDDVPAASPSDADVTAQLLPDVKRGFFSLWVERIRRSLGLNVQYFEANIAQLEALR